VKKILVINGHPVRNSFCSALAERYQTGANDAGSKCRLANLSDLRFDLNLQQGKAQELEPDLLKMQASISWADHLVFVYPWWWGSYPALLKGFIDRTFQSDFAFRYRKDSPLWDKLLEPKTARLVVTMDSPRLYYWLKYRGSGQNSMKTSILEFCGVDPVAVTLIGPVRFSTLKKREKWLREVEFIGKHE